MANIVNLDQTAPFLYKTAPSVAWALDQKFRLDIVYNVNYEGCSICNEIRPVNSKVLCLHTS